MRIELFNIDLNFTLPIYINISFFKIYYGAIEQKEMFAIFYNDGCFIINVLFKECVIKRTR